MKESKLEILSGDNIKKDKLKNYTWAYEWDTPYITIPKKEDRFNKKMNKLITNMGREINADLAVIVNTHTHYKDNTANHHITFYRQK